MSTKERNSYKVTATRQPTEQFLTEDPRENWEPTAVTIRAQQTGEGRDEHTGWGFQAHGYSGRDGDLQMDDTQSRGLSSYLEEDVKPLAGKQPFLAWW